MVLNLSTYLDDSEQIFIPLDGNNRQSFADLVYDSIRVRQARVSVTLTVHVDHCNTT